MNALAVICCEHVLALMDACIPQTGSHPAPCSPHRHTLSKQKPLNPPPTPPPPSRHTLSRQKPLNRVMSLPLAVSTVLQLGVVVAFQLLALLLLSRQPGYVATVGTPDLTMAQVGGREGNGGSDHGSGKRDIGGSGALCREEKRGAEQGAAEAQVEGERRAGLKRVYRGAGQGC